MFKLWEKAEILGVRHTTGLNGQKWNWLGLQSGLFKGKKMANENVRNPGKTGWDQKNGNAQRNYQNKAERAAWVKAVTPMAVWNGSPAFPLHTCNGKRSQALRNRASKRT